MSIIDLFEEHKTRFLLKPNLPLPIIALIYLFGFLVDIAGIISIFKIIPGDESTVVRIAFIIIFIVLTISIVFLCTRVYSDRIELIERNQFIEFTVKQNDPSYIIDEIKDTYNIKKNGDAIFNRWITISWDENYSKKHNSKKVEYWYEMSMKNSNKNIPQIIQRKDIKVDNPNTGKKLAKIFYSNHDDAFYYAIPLNPVLSPTSGSTYIHIKRYWRYAWRDLIEQKHDNTIFCPKFSVKKYQLSIILPKPYKFRKKILCSEQMGKNTLMFQEGHHFAEIEALNIPANNKIEFTVDIIKTKESS